MQQKKTSIAAPTAQTHNFIGCGSAYRTCYFDAITMMSANGKDDWMLIDGVPAKVLGFAESDCEKGAIVKKFSELRAVFRDPINSTKIGIWFSNKLSEKVKFVQLNSISTNLLKNSLCNRFCSYFFVSTNKFSLSKLFF